MPIKLSINTGFITNSSSVVHGFDRALLEDPDVAAFLRAYEIEDGYVGRVWNRSESSFAVTPEQKRTLIEDFTEGSLYSEVPVSFSPDDDSVVVIFGDEYTSLSSTLTALLMQASERRGEGHLWEQGFN